MTKHFLLRCHLMRSLMAVLSALALFLLFQPTATFAQDGVWKVNVEGGPKELKPEHWCKRPESSQVRDEIRRHVRDACSSPDGGEQGGQLLGYVSCILPKSSDPLIRTPLAVRRRTLNQGGKYKDENIYAGMPICAGDTVMTWKDISVSVQWLNPTKTGMPSEAYTLASYTQARLDPAGSQLYGGRMDIQADEDWKGREITLGEHGPEMRTSGSKITLAVTDRCSGEALVQVHDEPGPEGVHYAEIVRFNRRGKALPPDRVGQGEAVEVSNRSFRWLEKDERVQRLGGEEHSQIVVAELEAYRAKEDEAPPPVTDPKELGSLHVRVKPRSAEVYLGNRALNLRRGKGAAEYAPGRYTLTAQAQGYEADSTIIEIKEGERTEWEVSLRREEATPQPSPVPTPEPTPPPTPDPTPSPSPESTSSPTPEEAETPTPPEARRCREGYTYIGPGWFMMGSEGGKDNETPIHRVDIAEGFCMKTTEVSNGEYAQCVEAGGEDCTEIDYDVCDSDNPEKSQVISSPEHPANCLSWDQARAYARWVGGDLPSESQWEYAARAGAPLPGESEQSYAARAEAPRLFAWGNVVPGTNGILRGNFADRAYGEVKGPGSDIIPGYDDGFPFTAPVGSFPAGATPDGLLDMTGNVWEWTLDEWHDSYESEGSPAPDTEAPWMQSDLGGQRVIRGGGSSSGLMTLRAADRSQYNTGERSSFVGFRVALPELAAESDPQPSPATKASEASTLPETETCGAGYTYIGPGWFMMGSENGYSNETPVHRVDISSGFCMKTTEVTNAEYGRCVAEGGEGCSPIDYSFCTSDNEEKLAALSNPTHPAACISWDQAQAYSKWVGGRLPSESEWEYAARVGPRRPGESEAAYRARAEAPRTYAWGFHSPAEDGPVRTNGNGVGDNYAWTAPVGSFPRGATPEGLLDMTGNVWEWTQDEWHSNYNKAPETQDPWQSSEVGGRRVIRGGGWFSFPSFLRAAFRDWSGVGFRFSFVGFRVVLPPPGTLTP